MLFLITLGLMGLPYLLNPNTVKQAARKVERDAQPSQLKKRSMR